MSVELSFDDSLPDGQDFIDWLNKAHKNIHVSLFKHFSSKQPKPVIVKQQKLCNICIEQKDIDSCDIINCIGCKEGFICHDCVYEYVQHIPIYNYDDYCNDYKINCPICRKAHYITI